jgi:hypothetical protein
MRFQAAALQKLRRFMRKLQITQGNVMLENNPAIFHKLYGIRKPRVSYNKRDFLDYVLMLALSALAAGLSYGVDHVISIVGFALCVFTLAMFIVRHGVEFKSPLILRRPQDVLYLFVYKLQNLRPMWFIALGLLLLENFLIAATPNLPHHVELMRTIALWLFYIHFISITIFRTAILIDHFAKKELVREVLMQTPWKRAVNAKTNITLEILHAYCTGLLAHILLIAPWYLVITHASFSVIFLPAVCLINLIVHVKWLKAINAWFYRDHWLGHNSELEFIYLHGMHHDAIPSALIAVGENGFLEGFMRYTIGAPDPFYNPGVSFLVYMYEVANDVATHQYIPGVFPRLPRTFIEIAQHATHHFGKLEPYSFAMKVEKLTVTGFEVVRLPAELSNSIKLDEELDGFQWDNPTYRKTLSLYDKYHKGAADSKAPSMS